MKAYTTPAGEKGEAVVIELFDWRAYLQPYLPTPATGKKNGRKQ